MYAMSRVIKLQISTLFFSALMLLAAGQEASVFAPGMPMVITAGNDVGWQIANPEDARKAFQERGELGIGPEKLQHHWKEAGGRYAEHGVTAFEPYVKWMLLEPKEGVWDTAYFDAQLAALKEHGLKWVPFLIAGPAYATPPWFKESEESVFSVDLKTKHVTRDQSIWNPFLRPRIRAWLTRFFEHYDQKDMQAVLLGISGVFGESIYTAGGNEFTQIWDGEYPQHLGWWCGDAYARADFAQSMREKYKSIELLNEAWKSDYVSFDDVAPFVPEKTHTMRARLDLVRWYTGSMTEYAEWWVATARELAPEVPILLCTGGPASPELGADMTGQTKMVSRYGAGMRITNEASDYGTNFFLTRIIGSACRHYGTYFGYEPAGAVDTNGIVARIYNSVASGAWELFHYDNPPLEDRGAIYKRYRDVMQIREPLVEVGFLWSRTSADLQMHRGLETSAYAVRDITDIAFIDEQLIADGALKGLSILVWASGEITEPEAARTIQEAVEKGLTLIVPNGWSPMSPEGKALFPSEFTATQKLEGAVAQQDAPKTTRVGDGAVIQSASIRGKSLAPLLADVIRAPSSFGVRGLSPEASIDTKPDDVYLTVTTSDILLYNNGATVQTIATPAEEVEISPNTIVSIKKPQRE